MINVCINDKHAYRLPENWDEVIKEKKYPAVIAALYAEYKDEEALQLAVLQALIGWNGFELGKYLGAGNKSQRKDKEALVSIALAMQVKEQLLPAIGYIFNNLFVQCPIPELKVNGMLFTGPGNRLYNQTGHEMMLTHHSMVNFAVTQKEIHLDMMIAINYHKTIAGKRMAYDDETIGDMMKIVSKIPNRTKLGIYHWITRCEEWWYRKYEYMYSNEKNETASPNDKDHANLWRKILLRLADNKLGNDYDAVLRRTRQDIYFLLDQLEEERLRLEAEYNK